MITKVSVVIPVYNEEMVLADCLSSLKNQSFKNLETIVVDDGSTDTSKSIVNRFNVKLVEQSHKGAGNARNLGAKHAKGEVLVFVDADMTFDKNFVKDLVKPIQDKKATGTFSKNEMVANSNNVWSICWNINRNTPRSRMLPASYPSEAPVYRAILKKEFDKVKGFETSGDYTDDWSLFEKLGQRSSLAPGATYYHANPATLSEVWSQASWIGKNRFLTGSLPRKIKSLTFYSLPVSLVVAVFKSATNFYPQFVIFKLIYDLSIFLSVLKSFSKIDKFK